MSDSPFLKAFKGTPAEGDTLKLLGIRGFYEKIGTSPDGNRLGIYDDVIVRVVGSDTASFRGSTDPGLYFINHPIVKAGCAILQTGLWRYKQGRHEKKYKALVQAADVTVDRLNQQGIKVGEDTGDLAIHIHSGGPGEDVGKYSAGCQIIRCPEGYFGATWHTFFDPLSKAMTAAGQDVIYYRLMTIEEFDQLSP